MGLVAVLILLVAGLFLVSLINERPANRTDRQPNKVQRLAPAAPNRGKE